MIVGRNKIRCVLICGFLVLLAGLLLIRAGTFLVKKDKLLQADAIVLLMGSIPDRVLQTEQLYRQGLGRQIILVEENMVGYYELQKRGYAVINNTDQCIEALRFFGIKEEKIERLPGSARSTIQEALIIKDFLGTNHALDTLIVVTSPAHTRRASMIFDKVLRNNEAQVELFFSPSEHSTFNASQWWKSREDIQYVLAEYVKILSFLLIDQFKI